MPTVTVGLLSCCYRVFASMRKDTKECTAGCQLNVSITSPGKMINDSPSAPTTGCGSYKVGSRCCENQGVSAYRQRSVYLRIAAQGALSTGAPHSVTL